MLGGMGQLESHRADRAHIAEDDDCPGRVPITVMNRSDGVFDRDFKSATLDKNSVRQQKYGSVLVN
jgi:hypothetical protein